MKKILNKLMKLMNWQHISRLWSLTNYKNKFSLYLLLILAIFSSIAEVFTLGAIIPFVTVIANPEGFILNDKIKLFFNFFSIEDIGSIKRLVTFVFILMLIIAGSIRLALVYLTNKTAYLIGADMTQLIYSTSISQNYEFHINSHSSKMTNILVSKINASIQSTIIPFIQFISSMIISSFIIAMIIIIDPVVSMFIIFSLLSIFFMISFFTNKILLINGKIISKKHEDVIRLLRDSSSGIREVILYHMQSVFIDLYKKSDLLLRKSQAINAFIATSPRYLVEIIAITLLSLVAYFLNDSISSNLGAFAYIATVIFAAQRLLPIIQQIYLSWASIQGAKANVEDMLDFFDTLKKEKISSNKNLIVNFNHTLKFKNVSFYFSDGSKIIKKINFSINKGDKIGIIGKTGSGKSTILNLILGLIEPSSGEILIDNEKLTKDHLVSWHSKISSVSQNMFFLDDSIENNITFNINGKKTSKKKLAKALEVAQITEFIGSLKNGLDTKAGEDALKLSGGQRQRIAIARAIYKDSDLMILDEISSALDRVTEDKIMDSIYNLSNKTVIIVSHRTQSLKRCNKILKIDNGIVSKIGTYDEIIKSN